jgi:uncharacterized protein YndB with AHSA1/START domain
MTKQRTFKRKVRARMAKTGESYTAARRMLIAAGERPDSTSIAFEPPFSEKKLTEATGRGWQQWFDLLDRWDAVGKPHKQIARWLMSEHGVPGWWSQSITVGYERARGLRKPGQQADGWSVGASRTIGVPAQGVFDAFMDEAVRDRWLPDADMRLRKATPPRIARYDWEDGSTRVQVYVVERGEAKTTVTVQHEKLPDADTADEMKAWWRERVADLKKLLEGEIEDE